MEATRMRPDVVTFWHGPLDRLRLTCLRSQIAAGHKVTVYSFDPLPGLPDGVSNAEAEAILPHSADGRARRTVARRRRAPAEADRDRPGKALLRMGAPAPARQFGAVSAV